MSHRGQAGCGGQAGGGPSSDPDGPLDAARAEVPWLEPFPDALLGAARPGDAILTIGAGNVGRVIGEVAILLGARVSTGLFE